MFTSKPWQECHPTGLECLQPSITWKPKNYLSIHRWNSFVRHPPTFCPLFQLWLSLPFRPWEVPQHSWPLLLNHGKIMSGSALISKSLVQPLLIKFTCFLCLASTTCIGTTQQASLTKSFLRHSGSPSRIWAIRCTYSISTSNTCLDKQVLLLQIPSMSRNASLRQAETWLLV